MHFLNTLAELSKSNGAVMVGVEIANKEIYIFAHVRVVFSPSRNLLKGNICTLLSMSSNIRCADRG